MRAISLTNRWLSGIQKGLQTGHALVELSMLAREYEGKAAANLYETWATDHKTLIVLDGGSHQDLMDFYAFLVSIRHSIGNDLIYSYFKEDADSLSCAMTSVVVVISDRYEIFLDAFRRKDLLPIWSQLNEDEQELFQRLSKFRLAS